MDNNKEKDDLLLGSSIEDRILSEIDYIESLNDNTVAIQNITDKGTQIYNLDNDNILQK